jgi:hypothetical protein
VKEPLKYEEIVDDSLASAAAEIAGQVAAEP